MKNLLLLVFINLFFSPLSHSTPTNPPACEKDLKRLTSVRVGELPDPHEEDFNEVKKLLTAKRHISLLSPLYLFRDPMRLGLRHWHKHPYTVLGIDEAPFASLWARHALGLLNPEEAKKLEGEELSNLKARLSKILTTAHAYPTDVDTLALEAANIQLALKDVDSLLEVHGSRDSGIKGEISQLFWDSKKGTLELKKVHKYWGGIIALKIDRTHLDGLFNLKSRFRKIRQEARERSFEQALSLKNLEIYFHEFNRLSAGLPPGSTVWETDKYKEAKSIINSIASLYESTASFRVKENYRPASRSINKLKWKEFWFELSSIYFKDVPHLVEKARVKEILEKIKEMPEEERRALKLDKVAEHLSYFSRSKWAPIVFTTLLTATPLSWKSIYDFWFSEEIARQKCAIAENEKEYLDCAFDFLKSKFPGRLLLSDKDLSKLLTETGEVADLEIRAEIEELKRLRLEYIRELNLAKSLEEPIKIALGEGDKTSETFKERLITTTDEVWLKNALLGSATEVGYLEMRFLLAMKNEAIREIVEKAIQSSTDEERNTALENLANISLARIMAEDLRSLYKKRKSYQETGYYFPDSYSWRRPLIENEKK